MNNPMAVAIHEVLSKHESRCCDSAEDRLVLTEAMFEKVSVLVREAVNKKENSISGVVMSRNYWTATELARELGWVGVDE